MDTHTLFSYQISNTHIIKKILVQIYIIICITYTRKLAIATLLGYLFCSSRMGGGGGGGDFVSYVLHIKYVPGERPQFSTLNFRSGANHFSQMAKLFRSRALPFLVTKADFTFFSFPETIVFKIYFRSSR